MPGEIGHLLESRVGPQAEVAFLKSFGGDGFHVAQLDNDEFPRPTGLAGPRHTPAFTLLPN